MTTLTMFCGLPGSGKSTHARKLAAESGAVIICRDDLRRMVAGTYDQYQKMVFASKDQKFTKKMEGLVSDMATSCMALALHIGRPVIIDETNITPKRRAWWRSMAEIECPDVSVNVIWVKTPIEECIARRSKDTHKCDANWPAIIHNMNKAWQDPDIVKEHLNELKIIKG